MNEAPGTRMSLRKPRPVFCRPTSIGSHYIDFFFGDSRKHVRRIQASPDDVCVSTSPHSIKCAANSLMPYRASEFAAQKVRALYRSFSHIAVRIARFARA
jgi:hypothetical protein